MPSTKPVTNAPSGNALGVHQSPVTTKDHLSDELLFLINCCKTDLTEDDIKSIISYLSPITNYKSLITAASQHGILPLVYKTLKKLSESHYSLFTIHHSLEQLLADLKSAYSQIARRNMLMTSELIRIMKLLDENNIEALAFKGPALAQMAYGDITLRQYSDLDVLVDEDDAFRAAELMTQNGHEAILPLQIVSNKTCLHTAKDFSLMSKGGVHTELHWRLFEKKYNISLLSCAIEQKCQSVTINGHNIKTLQNELLLVYLCLHGAKHAFERIEWICDIDRLIRSTQIDWKEAIVIAEQSHSKRSFYLGLSLSHSLLNSSIPEELQIRSNQEDIQDLKKITLEKMKNNKEKTDFEKNKETFKYQANLFDSKTDMIRFRLSTFFKISTTDCQTFRLPENLKFLYIFLRPVRLIYSYANRLFVTRST